MIQFEQNKVYTNIHDTFIWNGYKPADSTNVTLDAVAATAFAPAAFREVRSDTMCHLLTTFNRGKYDHR